MMRFALLAVSLCLAGCLDFQGLTRNYPSDLGSGDGPLASLPCPTGALFCDGFEAGLTKWSTDPQAASFITLDADASDPHSGRDALHATITANANGLGAENELTTTYSSTASGRLASRVYMSFGEPLGDYASLFELASNPNPSPYSGYAVLVSQSEGWLVSHLPLVTGSDHPSAPTTQPPLNQWLCVELVLDMPAGAQPGHVTLYVDGQTLVSFDDATLDATTTAYGSASIGVIRAQADRDEERYFDDVALATERIGCP